MPYRDTLLTMNANNAHAVLYIKSSNLGRGFGVLLLFVVVVVV